MISSLAASRLELFAADVAAGGADERALVEPPVGHEADGDLLLREEARVRVVQHHDVEAPVGALVLIAAANEARMLFQSWSLNSRPSPDSIA